MYDIPIAVIVHRMYVVCTLSASYATIATTCMSAYYCALMLQPCSAEETLSYKLILLCLTQTSKNAHWLDNYLRGAAMEVYTERFSPQFHGLPFTTVSL